MKTHYSFIIKNIIKACNKSIKNRIIYGILLQTKLGTNSGYALSYECCNKLSL